MPALAAGGAGAASPPPPRAMKRELAFALQSLSEISASPGRTRSGRPDPGAASPPPPPQTQPQPQPQPPRAMKRELAFALQSLSEICASPGRTRSGRPISHPDPSSAASLAAAAKRRKRSTEAPAPAAADLVSPPTPPIDDEPPKPSPPLLDPSDGSNAPTATADRGNGWSSRCRGSLVPWKAGWG